MLLEMEKRVPNWNSLGINHKTKVTLTFGMLNYGLDKQKYDCASQFTNQYSCEIEEGLDYLVTYFDQKTRSIKANKINIVHIDKQIEALECNVYTFKKDMGTNYFASPTIIKYSDIRMISDNEFPCGLIFDFDLVYDEGKREYNLIAKSSTPHAIVDTTLIISRVKNNTNDILHKISKQQTIEESYIIVLNGNPILFSDTDEYEDSITFDITITSGLSSLVTIFTIPVTQEMKDNCKPLVE